MEKILSKKIPHKPKSLCGAKSARAHKQKPLCNSKRTTLIAFAHNPRAQAFTLGGTTAHKPCAQALDAHNPGLCAQRFFPLNIIVYNSLTTS